MKGLDEPADPEEAVRPVGRAKREPADERGARVRSGDTLTDQTGSLPYPMRVAWSVQMEIWPPEEQTFSKSSGQSSFQSHS